MASNHFKLLHICSVTYNWVCLHDTIF